MIDFHNHILPDVDDGPKTLEVSIDMVTEAARQGITDIVNTVHFQHPKMDNKNIDYVYLNNKLKNLQLEIDNRKLNIKLHLSAEVFYLPNLLEISNNPIVTIGEKKYMLIEFSSNIFPTGYENEFYKLQLNGITPIVAHPERYRFIQNDINILNGWIKKGYIIQIDAGSILGRFGEKIKNITFSMIENNSIHLIGSDAHNNKKRNFLLLDAYNLIEKNFSINLVKELKENSFNLLSGLPINNVISRKNKVSSLKKKLFKLINF